MKQYYVYILTNSGNQRFYIGVTNDLFRRVYEHKNELCKKAFSKYYNLHKLVYFEVFSSPDDAITRETFLKKAYKKYKVSLINKANVDWNDLYDRYAKF